MNVPFTLVINNHYTPEASGETSGSFLKVLGNLRKLQADSRKLSETSQKFP
jgi:hypothetical protein